MTLEQQQRAAVVAEARSWIGTPYHHRARVKGAGVDCAQILVGVFSAPGVALIPALTIPHYPPDWHLNRAAERYLGTILEMAREIPGDPAPGDVVLFRFGRCFAHGGIVVEWPRIVHAWAPAHRVVEGNVAHDSALSHIGERGPELGHERPRRFFSYWGR